MILISRGKAYQLTSQDNSIKVERVFELDSNQEETDTRVVVYAHYAATHGYKSVQVRSPDSDVYFILLHHAPRLSIQILFDTGSGNKKRLMNITEQAGEFGKKHSESLLSLHALTGCDTTSCFKGIGKIKPIQVLKKYPEFEDYLVALGEDWELDEISFRGVENFICHLYGVKRFVEVDKLRYHMLQKKCNNSGVIDPKKIVDLGALPPCQSSLRQHVIRTNFQVY